MRRLWSILFYKELGFSLDDIRLILDNPKEMEKELMRQHKQILLERQSQLQKMILSVDMILNDKFDISMLRDFDKSRIETLKKTYANEIQELIESSFFLPLVKSGVLQGNVSIFENASTMMTLDFDKLIALCTEVIQKFDEAMKDDPESLSAKEAVTIFRELITIWIPSDDNTFRKIGQAYLKYKEDLDKKTPGLAEFVSAAIRHIYP
nr:TipAS antibiotic-recognition domain-containing protein [Terrisporobacter petrolearius]